MSDLTLESYCSELEILLDRRHTELALIEKQRAEMAASMAREAVLRAEAADRAKTAFLANMSHELRTPLNAIIGFSELIKLKIRPPSPEYNDYILDAGRHLIAIITGMLDLARAGGGKIELAEEVVSIRELISGSIRAIRPLAENKSINILSESESDQDTVWGDPARLKQIFINLLSNGVKFTPKGGQITVLSRTGNNGDLVISFTDTGIGIPAEGLPIVFEPLERLENHMTRENEGTGLGLPIARALARLHGGNLILSSEVGVGTTAEIHLPADRVRPNAAVRIRVDRMELPVTPASSQEGQPPSGPAVG